MKKSFNQARKRSVHAVLFQQALTLHQHGQLAQAKAIYAQILLTDPKHFDALHLSGVVAHQTGNHALALELISRAIEINANHAVAYSNRGLVLKELERFEEAVANYDKAIAVQPNFPDAYSNRGVAMKELKRFNEAIANFDRAVAFEPNHAQAYNNKGNALKDIHRFDEALACYAKAIAIRPSYAQAYNNRGSALEALHRLDEALANYDKAIEIKPDYGQAHFNRGAVLHQLKRSDEALACYDRAIAINPSDADAHWNKSLGLLLEGKLAQAWSLYEWRWRYKYFPSPKRNFAAPLWLGLEDLKNKTILLHAEQGLGDTIQFCRYAHLVKRKGARVVMEVPHALMGLLTRLESIDELVQTGQPLPAFDYHCPLLSLPLAFKTDLGNIPSPQPYLAADSAKVRAWEQRLGTKNKPRIGLVWSGSTGHKNDHNRSLQLETLRTYLPQNFEYVSLQKELRDVDQLPLTRSAIQHYGTELNDFTDTAAMCECMDVVISVDTSVVHLAAAMGKPTWVLLPHVPDWRWLLDRNDSPWYQSIKLYRQDDARSWLPVLARVAHDLQTFQL